MVVASIGVAEALYRVTHSTRLSMVFLAAVLVAGFLLGSGPAFFAVALTFLIFNFYLVDPRFGMSFGTPDDLLTLSVFLVVAILTGTLTGRLRDEAIRTRERAKTTDVLVAATRQFLAQSDENVICGSLARHLSDAAGGPALVVGAGQCFAVGLDEGSEEVARLIAGAAQGTTPHRWTVQPLGGEGGDLGLAAWKMGARSPHEEADRRLLEVLVDAAAAAIERARLANAKADAETRARTEDLRNALLSSISHDLRTPLAAIVASASSLSAFGDTFDAKVRKDLATTIEEEAARLDAFVVNLLSMTRLEAGALAVQTVAFSVPEVVERAVVRRNPAARSVSVRHAPDLPEGLGDPILFEQALGNVVENALRYSPPDRPLAIVATSSGDEVVVEVVDEGPGAPPQDLERLFEKFFRSSLTANKPGTGLGLAIARGLMQGMDGEVRAQNRDDAPCGLRVTLSLPRAA